MITNVYNHPTYSPAEVFAIQEIFDGRCKSFHSKRAQILSKRPLQLKSSLSTKSWNREYASIIMHYGRQTGATYWTAYMINLINHNNEADKCTVLFNNHGMKKRAYENYYKHHETLSHNTGHNLLTHYDIIHRPLSWENDKFVFIDCFPLLKHDELNILYSKFKGELLIFT